VRDVGFLIWVVLLFVGVVGSIVSSIRKQARRPGPQFAVRPPQRPPATPQPAVPAQFVTAAPQPGELPQWLDRMLQAQASQPPAAIQRPVAMKPVPPKPAPKPAPPKPVPPKPSRAAEPLIAEHHEHSPKARRLFHNRSDLVRAVVAAEVLGKPRGLADEYPYR
jgi:hypothetical protein